MDRRKFLVGMGSLAAGGAAALGTGAFSRVSADRTVSVNVADDSSALLKLDASNAVNGEYAKTSNGQIEVDLDNSDATNGGSGLNKNADTTILDIFRVTNQGTQPVLVYVDPDTVSPDIVTADGDNDGNKEYVDEGGIYIDPQASGRPNEVNFVDQAISFTGIYGVFDPTTGFAGTNTYDAKDLTLGVGESMNFGLSITTKNPSNTDFEMSMDIVADTEIAGNV